MCVALGLCVLQHDHGISLLQQTLGRPQFSQLNQLQYNLQTQQQKLLLSPSQQVNCCDGLSSLSELLSSRDYLLIEINEEFVGKFQVLDGEQHDVPLAVGDVPNEAVDAVDRVKRHGGLLLKHRQRAVQIILLQILHDQANHAANVTGANEHVT